MYAKCMLRRSKNFVLERLAGTQNASKRAEYEVASLPNTVDPQALLVPSAFLGCGRFAGEVVSKWL